MDSIQNILKEEFKTKEIKRKLLLSLIYIVVTGLIYIISKASGLIFSVNLVFIHITLPGLIYGIIFLASLWTIYALSIILDTKKKIIPRAIISVTIALVLIFTAFAGLLIAFAVGTFYEFTSDDGKNIAVISEREFLFSTTLHMYKRENLFFLRKIEEDFFTTSDQGYIMGGDAYETEWDGSVFKIKIYERFGPYTYKYDLNNY